MGLSVANLLVSAYLTGVAWFLAVVHYPLMPRVGPGTWPGYELADRGRTALVTALPTLALSGLAVALLARPPDDVATATLIALLVVAVVPLMITATVTRRARERLTEAWNARAHRRLSSAHWLRTLAWTAHTALSTAVVLAAA